MQLSMRPGRGEIPMQVDPRVVPALRDYQHGLTTAVTSAAVVDELQRLVRALGGRVVPAREVDEAVLPVDLTLGTAEPLLPESEPSSVARLHLEEVLPGAVELAQAALLEIVVRERERRRT
jgi:hypothetical protein